MTLLEQIQKEHAAAFTHGGKFHADDVFSAALLLHFNPQLTIQRGNRVPEDFAGIVFDIGRGEYDHHQKDSRIRENQVPYAAFGLLWEALGTEILSPEMAARFDEKFVQPLDLNDNTGEKNELASMIGMFNPVWDDNSGSDAAFLEAVAVAGRILEHKWERFRADERAEQQFAALLAEHRKRIAAEKKAGTMDEKILILSEFFPCHKGGFLLTAETLDDAVAACRISLAGMPKAPVLIHIGTDAIDADDALLWQMPGMEHAVILHKPLPEAPELNICGCYAVSSLEKAEWKIRLREYLADLLKEKPEAVCVSGDLFAAYPVMHQLRKKHIPVLTASEQNGKRILVRIPSGS